MFRIFTQIVVFSVELFRAEKVFMYLCCYFLRDNRPRLSCPPDSVRHVFLASLKCSVPELNYCSTLVPFLAIDGRAFQPPAGSGKD